MATISSGLTFDSINSSIGLVTTSRETSLKQLISGLGESPTTADMLNMQQQIQQWSMMVEIQSTITKQIADSLKGVIQKAS